MKAFVSRWWPLLAVIAWAMLALVASPSSPMAAMALPGLSAFVVLAVLVVALIVSVVRKSGRPTVVVLSASLVICLLVGALFINGGPLWLRFFASRDQLHDAAILAVQGRPPATPAHIGMFTVSDIEVEGGVVRFRTHEDEWVDEGLAFFPDSLAELDSESTSHIRLGWYKGQWYVYALEAGT